MPREDWQGTCRSSAMEPGQSLRVLTSMARLGTSAFGPPTLRFPTSRCVAESNELVPFDPTSNGVNANSSGAPRLIGLSGNVCVIAPTLDIAGSMKALSTHPIDHDALGRDLCRVGAGSSLHLSASVADGRLPLERFDWRRQFCVQLAQGMQSSIRRA